MKRIVARRIDTGQPVTVGIRSGQIESIVPAAVASEQLTDLPFVGAGLFDLQVNGFDGIWFSSEQITEQQVEQVIVRYLEQGIARCFPTLITNSAEAIEHGLSTIRKACERSVVVNSVVAGCHVEGPFISPLDGPRGAHPVRHVRPASMAELQRWQRAAGGRVRLLTLAPESPGALEFIPKAIDAGVKIAVGHTAASAEVISQAINAGACLGTHLGNGCAGMVPRHDNVFWPQLSDDRISCSVIADGWHVPASMLTCILRCKSLERIVLTCDVSGFGGCAPGRYRTGDVEVDVLPDGRIVVAGQTQFLAGSGATTGECVLRFAEICGLLPGSVWSTASHVPARLMQLPHYGLYEGSPAVLTVFRIPGPGVFQAEATFSGSTGWQRG